MRRILRSPINKALVLAILTLYAAFIYLDIFTSHYMWANFLKFVSIVLCFGLAIALYKCSGERIDSKFVVMALFVTVIADIFLIFTSYKLAGVLTFCLVQLIYLKRYNHRLFNFGIVVLTAGLIATFFLPLPTLTIMGATYAILILTCFFATFKTDLSRFNLKCVRVGMLLFILCDVYVALYNQLLSSSAYYQIAGNLIWIFYLPAQLLLAMSSYHPRRYT